jgi:hypothetical protein
LTRRDTRIGTASMRRPLAARARIASSALTSRRLPAASVLPASVDGNCVRKREAASRIAASLASAMGSPELMPSASAVPYPVSVSES